jgi:hypothetical protein
MIIVPKTFQNNVFSDKKFIDLINRFNELERQLQYPNCEGTADTNRILAKFQNDLIKDGVI